jgi:hypothetical protein
MNGAAGYETEPGPAAEIRGVRDVPYSKSNASMRRSPVKRRSDAQIDEHLDNDAVQEAEFAEILARGRELRNIEHKGPGRRDNRAFLARVVRAVIGTANLRDGGIVTIGVTEVDGKLIAVGVVNDDLRTWSNYDDVASSVGEYTHPSVTFDVEVLAYRGANVVLLHVEEFAEIPILCAKDAQEGNQLILRRGALYVRGRRRMETAEVPTQDEMREILDLATEKAVRRYIEVTRRTGFQVGPAGLSDDELYDLELGQSR